MEKIILITGSSRGIGLELANLSSEKGLKVIACVRNEEGLKEIDKISQLAQLQGRAPIEGFVLDAENMENIAPKLITKIKTADILVNNAGVGYGTNGEPESASILNLDQGTLLRSLKINAFSAQKMMSLCVPEMVKRGWGRVVNVTSLRAKLSEYVGEGMGPSYRLSKLMLTGMTVWAAAEVQDTGVLINCVCPGWCATRMGGEHAPDTPKQGAQRILNTALLPDGGPNGKFFSGDKISDF